MNSNLRRLSILRLRVPEILAKPAGCPRVNLPVSVKTSSFLPSPHSLGSRSYTPFVFESQELAIVPRIPAHNLPL